MGEGSEGRGEGKVMMMVVERYNDNVGDWRGGSTDSGNDGEGRWTILIVIMKTIILVMVVERENDSKY